MNRLDYPKSFNSLDDVERYVISEYYSWAKSQAPVALKLAMVDEYFERAKNLNIEHLILERKARR